MRVGAFELEVTFSSILSIAEVHSGKAPLLRSFQIQNVRGNESDWLNISAVIGGRTKRKAIRNLPVFDNLAAAHCESKIRAELLLPSGLQPGRHEGELRIEYNGDGEKKIPFSLTILPSSWMPTDFAHARYLASWICTADNDELRGFAAEALQGTENDRPQQCIRALYEALVRKNLMYQPPVSTVYPDFQPVSNYHYILNKGGSCADLSLLMASLLWIRGFSPAILLYQDHMTAGCFSDAELPDFEVLDNPGLIADMISGHHLLLPEITGVCSHQGISFADSLNLALDKVRQNKSGCCLINIKTILRHQTVQPLPAALLEEPIICPHCGFDHILPNENGDEICCPSCALTFRPAREPVPMPAAVPEITYDPKLVRYECKSGKAGVARCLPGAAGGVQILPRWQDRPVAYIASRAFDSSRLSSITLPESITEIGDRAFRGCANLTNISLPSVLSRLGTGAFSLCGLQSIRIPGSVARVPTLCFAGCSQLETVTLEDGIREIDSQSFMHCPNLKCVYIPASVQNISRTAFDPSCRLILASDSIQFV